MFKTKVTYSIEEDPFIAGEETASKASKMENIKLGMLFTNCEMDQKKIVEGVKSVLGSKPLIGATSGGGIIVPDGYIKDNYVGMMSFGGDDLIVGIAYSEAGNNAREIGKQIARDAITNAGIKKVPSYFYMVASPKEEEKYLKGIEDVIGIVPFFGGSTANNNKSCEFKIICNDKIITDGCAVAFFYAKNECKTYFTGAYEETNTYGVITELDGPRKLVKINNKPALKQYADWIKVNPNDLMGNNLFMESIYTPLGVKDPLGSITAIRHPLIGNSDYSMNISNDLAIGTSLIKLETTKESILKAHSECLEKLNAKMKKEATSYLLIESVGRKIGLEEKIEDVRNEIKSVIGVKDFLMVFTFGEYGSNDHSANTCGNLMLSFTGFSE